jgi:hypothetical protein
MANRPRRSRPDNPWDVFLGDQLAVMTISASVAFSRLGFCIGCSFALNLAKKAPDRLTAAVLCQPIGHRPEDPDVLHESGVTWGKELTEKRSDVDMPTVEQLTARAISGTAGLRLRGEP